MLLAIDTSTRYAGVALLNTAGQLIQLLQWRSQRNHTVELLPAVETLLAREHATVQDLTGLAVALGPGSFSALRVGLAVAKGLALARGLPIATVTTLEAEAYAHLVGGFTICPVLDAGRGQLAWATFAQIQGELSQTSEERISTPEELLSSLPSPALLCGEGVEQYGEALSTSAPKGVVLALPYLPGQRVSALAYLGNIRLKAGQVQDPASVQPLYVRQPTITESRRHPLGTAP
ncbi:MAG: tRNA (adenosine(37)-N6)-threonylcarbamoyltransferase complex dimerization subunit type 1 TsaB [Dehalococcoidia bacterium]